MGRDVQSVGWAAYVDAVGGAPERAAAIASELRKRTDAAARAWAIAIDVAVWQASTAGSFPADPEVARDLGRQGAVASAGASVVCVDGARSAWLSGNEAWAAAWVGVTDMLVNDDAGIVVATRDLTLAYHAAATGQWSGVERSAAAAERSSRSARLAPFVIEATALQALGRLAVADLDEGVAAARRAMRMARTEELAQPSYLAGFVLARARRLAGHYHLASRILESLARVVPPLWANWLAWERSLAGVPPRDAPEPAASLNRWVRAFETSQTDEIPRLGAELHAAVQAQAAFREDAEALAAALGATVSCPRAMQSFRHDVAPRCASGFEGLPRPLGPQIMAIVEVRRDAPAIRRLALASAIAEPVLCSSKPGRPEAVLAALTLAGTSGAAVPSLFRHVYGFEFVTERHANVFDVVLHRARALLGERGDLSRDGDELRFALREPFSVPDMSLQGSLTDRVLHSLAVRAKGSAKEIAEDLHMPLRTVQSLLRELVDQGACSSERSARSVEYIVEDTTFKEPTSLGWRRD